MLTTNVRRTAFTLVEMAIVIVIIGLLVGGVVASRSYIRSAEINSMMTESKYYINALGQFQAQYKALPGDMGTAANVWSGTTSGDGNGLIYAGTANTQERYLAWQHLALAGLIDGTYTGATDGGTNNATIAINVPRGSIQGVTYVFDHPTATDGNVSSDSFYIDGLYFHVLRVGGVPTPSNGLNNSPFLTPTEAMETDRKFDDAKPSTGWIMVPKNSALGNCTTDSTSTVYNTSYGSKGCTLILKIQ